MNDIYELLSEEDLTSDLQLINTICGMNTVKTLLSHCQGMGFYIPKFSRMDTFVAKCLKKYPDKSFKQLAADLRVSEQYVRDVYKRNVNKKK